MSVSGSVAVHQNRTSAVSEGFPFIQLIRMWVTCPQEQSSERNSVSVTVDGSPVTNTKLEASDEDSPEDIFLLLFNGLFRLVFPLR